MRRIEFQKDSMAAAHAAGDAAGSVARASPQSRISSRRRSGANARSTRVRSAFAVRCALPDRRVAASGAAVPGSPARRAVQAEQAESWPLRVHAPGTLGGVAAAAMP